MNNLELSLPFRVKPLGIRNSHIHEALLDGLRLYVTVSFYSDGRIAEIYIASGKQGSLEKGLLDCISTLASEMLQYGVPLDALIRNLKGQKFSPSGFVEGHPYIKFADSIADLIGQILEYESGSAVVLAIAEEARGG